VRGSLRVEPLTSRHDRSSFSSGVEALDRYLHQQAGQDMRKRVACCYVLTRAPEPERVLGFYTLSNNVIPVDALPAPERLRLPRYPFVPATLIGRLAVSQEARGQGFGLYLLFDALALSLDQSRRIASVAVVVDAKNYEARTFYEKFGFLALQGRDSRLFLPMKTIEHLIGR